MFKRVPKRRYAVFYGNKLQFLFDTEQKAIDYWQSRTNKEMYLIMYKDLDGTNPTPEGVWIYWSKL